MAIAAFLTFLNVILKGLKHETFKGYKAWNVCEGKNIMFNPTSWANVLLPIKFYDCHTHLKLINVNWLETFHLE
jgi:hypothetical protein